MQHCSTESTNVATAHTSAARLVWANLGAVIARISSQAQGQGAIWAGERDPRSTQLSHCSPQPAPHRPRCPRCSRRPHLQSRCSWLAGYWNVLSCARAKELSTSTSWSIRSHSRFPFFIWCQSKERRKMLRKSVARRGSLTPAAEAQIQSQKVGYL